MSIVLLSGGLDSLVLLARECQAGAAPLCLSFHYGQRHGCELAAAARIASHYRAPWETVVLPILHGAALTDAGVAIPHAHYTDPAQNATVVPNRNMVFLAVAASWAVRMGHAVVLFAAHAGDAAIYPDCRREFVSTMDRTMRLACDVGVEAPFLSMTKRAIVQLGRRLRAPLELSWSCYEGGETPCGGCGACVERTEALGSA